MVWSTIEDFDQTRGENYAFLIKEFKLNLFFGPYQGADSIKKHNGGLREALMKAFPELDFSRWQQQGARTPTHSDSVLI